MKIGGESLQTSCKSRQHTLRQRKEEKRQRKNKKKQQKYRELREAKEESKTELFEKEGAPVQRFKKGRFKPTPKEEGPGARGIGEKKKRKTQLQQAHG